MSNDEIMGLARQIRDLAVARRGREELHWARKGEVSDETFANPNFRHDLCPGGTTKDYAMLEQGYQWIVDGFQNAIGPDPSGFDSSIQSMEAVSQKLRGNNNRVIFNAEMGKDGKVNLTTAESIDQRAGELGKLLMAQADGWSGDAAANFKENFAVYVPDVFANQVLLVSSLKSALQTNQAVYAMAREDLKGIAKATIDALNFKTGSDGPNVSLTLSVVAGILGVTAACVTGPGAIIFFTVASSAAAVGKDFYDNAHDGDDKKPKGKEYHIEGYTVDTILQSTFGLINKAQEYVTTAEDTLINGLRDNLNLMNSAADKKYFVSPRPSIADTSTDLKTVRDGYQFYPD